MIVVFWRTTCLRKKHCYFMIMVLSCCDLLSILVNHTIITPMAMFFLIKNSKIFSPRLRIIFDVTTVFQAMSLLALLVMNLDRYLAISPSIISPNKHHKTETFVNFRDDAIYLYHFTYILYWWIVYSVDSKGNNIHVVIYASNVFINYKLLKISRKHQSFKFIYHDKNNLISLKQVSLCLMAFASLLFFTVLCLMLLVYNIILPVTRMSYMFSLWFKTIFSTSSFISFVLLCLYHVSSHWRNLVTNLLIHKQKQSVFKEL